MDIFRSITDLTQGQKKWKDKSNIEKKKHTHTFRGEKRRMDTSLATADTGKNRDYA